jgi:hypothetical protein
LHVSDETASQKSPSFLSTYPPSGGSGTRNGKTFSG